MILTIIILLIICNYMYIWRLCNDWESLSDGSCNGRTVLGIIIMTISLIIIFNINEIL